MDVVNTWDQPWRVKFEREMFAAKRKPGCATINNHQATRYLWIWQDVTTVQCWFVLEVKLDLTQPSGNRQLWGVWMRGVKLPASVSSVALPSMICTYSSIQNPGIAIHAIWKNRVQSLKNIKKNIISSSFQYGGMKETHWIRKWKCDFHAKTKKKLFWSPHCNLTLLYI